MTKSLADIVVNTSLRIKPEETVVINTWQHTLSLASQIAYQVRKAGALPLMTLDMDELWWKSLTELPVENLRKPLRHNLALLDETDASINLSGPEDPMTYRRVQGPQIGALFESFQKSYDKIREKKIRSADLQIGLVTEPRAKTYGFNYDQWKKNVEDASNADYEKMAQLGKKLASKLEHARHVEVASDGTNLRKTRTKVSSSQAYPRATSHWRQREAARKEVSIPTWQYQIWGSSSRESTGNSRRDDWSR
ncbi:MAG: hypothetical protein AUI93_00550 [Crenarchaeota archaeon 13_1_40CM_3_52_10]|nr:MAG: hypothetical protein AUI93_00550 [Crenarchaeota archaeon 13_1_40CM_3_52_10]